LRDSDSFLANEMESDAEQTDAPPRLDAEHNRRVAAARSRMKLAAGAGISRAGKLRFAVFDGRE
jgi:hypothetical protein